MSAGREPSCPSTGILACPLTGFDSRRPLRENCVPPSAGRHGVHSSVFPFKDAARRSRSRRAQDTGRWNAIDVCECAAARGRELDDRGRAAAERAARLSAPTRTQPRERSRLAGAKGLTGDRRVMKRLAALLRCGYCGAAGQFTTDGVGVGQMTDRR